MTNAHIELVKTWLADKNSVSREELKANSRAAYAADYESKNWADVSYAAKAAACANDAAAQYATYDAECSPFADAAAARPTEAAKHWVERYEGLNKL